MVAAEPSHVERLLRLLPDATNIALINDFNPALQPGTPLIDPWYGDEAGFQHTLDDIEAAMDGVLQAVVDRAARGER